MARQPVSSNDAQGECLHLYMTREATCAHCGMHFALAWQAGQGWITSPLRKNMMLALVSGSAYLFLRFGGVDGLMQALLLVAGVLFLTRTILGGLEPFARHGFVPGKLGTLYTRSRLNLLAPKPNVAEIGRVKFPLDKDTYYQFKEGDTLLVEHLRWSRLPVAIYKGTLPSK
jgi:hypothetical protein